MPQCPLNFCIYFTSPKNNKLASNSVGSLKALIESLEVDDQIETQTTVDENRFLGVVALQQLINCRAQFSVWMESFSAGLLGHR